MRCKIGIVSIGMLSQALTQEVNYLNQLQYYLHQK